ncbi:IS4 family transposase [Leptothoe spongobia]|uniref:IS4 family transposase n=1 Tax=Leptothoe spongobia TAU-MAC 1115 TaxID=1967444 RepID=A0A947GL14_9CYAN|nr:IS4 family transposase [Leptothoe spongobia]MBT9317994.1 IS4 family transposase [Leptothoe spongobia TAU-MAC 1115]
MPKSAEILKHQLFKSIGLPWRDILPEARLDELLSEEGITYRNRPYTPIVTLWAMLYQALSADKSLRNTVKGITTWLTAAGVRPPSSDTGAYSKARDRLPESLLQRLIPETAERLEQTVPKDHYWCGRCVKVFDGTTVLMADSEANQDAYPQHGNQAVGCGFPLARVVVFFCLLTGAVVSGCIAPKTTSEIVMSRWLYQDLSPDDVAMADQAYGSYVDLALIQQQGADGVLRKHHARHTDFRKGRKHGLGDHQVVWHKPNRRPTHMSADEFAAIPQTLMVREVRLKLSRKGFRDQFIIVVTTLLDAKRYPASQLTRLYGWRWHAAEVNLRHLKTTLKMEMLTAKTPERVRKEIWSHLLAYNVLRSVMEQASPFVRYERNRLSLQGARQHFNQMLTLLATTSNATQQRLYDHLLQDIAADLLPQRPNRHEPRVVKRRPKPFPRMRQPRPILKAKLAA